MAKADYARRSANEENHEPKSLTILALTGLLTIIVATAATASERPNAVLMLADNVGWGDIGAYGGGEMRGMPTPRIDSIAVEYAFDLQH